MIDLKKLNDEISNSTKKKQRKKKVVLSKGQYLINRYFKIETEDSVPKQQQDNKKTEDTNSEDQIEEEEDKRTTDKEKNIKNSATDKELYKINTTDKQTEYKKKKENKVK